MKTLDLVAIGEVLVEFSQEPSNGSPAPTLWRATWAGDVVNTLFYSGRLGLRTGLVSRFGSDPFTGMITEGIGREGIDLTFSDVDPQRPNGLYFITLDQEGERHFHYRRSESAARHLLDDVPSARMLDYLKGVEIVYVTGITLAVLTEREPLYRLLGELREAGTTRVAFDPNVRPILWESAEAIRREVGRILPLVDIFLPSMEDLRLLYGEDVDPDALVESIPVRHTLVTNGREGASLYVDGRRHLVSGNRGCPVVDTTGAGDGMKAGYLAGILHGMSSSDALQQGVCVAEHIIGVPGAIDPGFRIDHHRESKERGEARGGSQG